MSGEKRVAFSLEFPSEHEHMFLEMHEVFTRVCVSHVFFRWGGTGGCNSNPWLAQVSLEGVSID